MINLLQNNIIWVKGSYNNFLNSITIRFLIGMFYTYKSLNIKQIVMIYVRSNYFVPQYDTFDFIVEICSVKVFALEKYSNPWRNLPFICLVVPFCAILYVRRHERDHRLILRLILKKSATLRWRNNLPRWTVDCFQQW